jgi:hypothetical protein
VKKISWSARLHLVWRRSYEARVTSSRMLMFSFTIAICFLFSIYILNHFSSIFQQVDRVPYTFDIWHHDIRPLFIKPSAVLMVAPFLKLLKPTWKLTFLIFHSYFFTYVLGQLSWLRNRYSLCVCVCAGRTLGSLIACASQALYRIGHISVRKSIHLTNTILYLYTRIQWWQ